MLGLFNYLTESLYSRQLAVTKSQLCFYLKTHIFSNFMNTESFSINSDSFLAQIGFSSKGIGS